MALTWPLPPPAPPWIARHSGHWPGHGHWPRQSGGCRGDSDRDHCRARDIGGDTVMALSLHARRVGIASTAQAYAMPMPWQCPGDAMATPRPCHGISMAWPRHCPPNPGGCRGGGDSGRRFRRGRAATPDIVAHATAIPLWLSLLWAILGVRGASDSESSPCVWLSMGFRCSVV